MANLDPQRPGRENPVSRGRKLLRCHAGVSPRRAAVPTHRNPAWPGCPSSMGGVLDGCKGLGAITPRPPWQARGQPSGRCGSRPGKREQTRGRKIGARGMLRPRPAEMAPQGVHPDPLNAVPAPPRGVPLTGGGVQCKCYGLGGKGGAKDAARTSWLTRGALAGGNAYWLKAQQGVQINGGRGTRSDRAGSAVNA